MSGRKRPFSCRAFIVIFHILLLVFAISCSEQPTRVLTQPRDTSGFTGEGEIDPGSEGKFLLGTVEDTTLYAGYIEVWAMDVAYDGNSGNVSFDVQLGNETECPIPAPVHFVIISVVPSDISAVDFDGISEDSFPFYDFSSKLGSDNILEPGEISDGVTMHFHLGEPRSFSIGFRIDFGAAPDTGVIAGMVFRDDNENGVRDLCDGCEPGISGITITLHTGSDKNAENLLITHTDANGEYRFSNLKEGVYTVRAQAPSALWELTSPNPLLVTLIKGSDEKIQDFLGADFGLFPLEVLLLWNKLGSAQEVQNSEVGPEGTIDGDIEFLPGKYGNGFRPLPRTGDHNIPSNYIDFNGLKLGPQGCVEFWYQPNWDSPSVGHVVELFNYGVEDSYPSSGGVMFCGYNDWQNLFGFQVRNCTGEAGATNLIGTSIRPSSLPAWTTAEPFHMAFTWDGEAVDPNDRVKVFVNGDPVAVNVSVRGDPKFDAWQEDFRLRLGCRLNGGDWDRHNWEGSQDGVIDNLKVWSFPKTDFSDRFVE